MTPCAGSRRIRAWTGSPTTTGDSPGTSPLVTSARTRPTSGTPRTGICSNGGRPTWPRYPDAEKFVGIPQASADFSHFVFSSNVVFAADGEASGTESSMLWIGYTWRRSGRRPRSTTTTCKRARSSWPRGERRHPFKGRAFDISEDGSHILMAEEDSLDRSAGADWHSPARARRGPPERRSPGPLYLRVDGNETYEIATGPPVRIRRQHRRWRHRLPHLRRTADAPTITTPAATSSSGAKATLTR